MTDRLMITNYYGGKNRPKLQDAILSRLRVNKGYLEPFCGSAAIILNRWPRAVMEVINDVDGNVVNFFKVLRDRPGELIDALSLTPHARDEFDDCCAAMANPDSLSRLERARCWYAISRMSGRGRYGSHFDANNATPSGRSHSKAKAFRNATQRNLLACAKRLTDVTIENIDAVDLIRKHDDPEWTIYCDPPYPDESRTAPAARYKHDGSGDLHRRLLDACKESRASICISSYPNDLYAQALRGWHAAEVKIPKTSSDNGGYAIEMLYTNWAPARQATFF